MTIWLKASGEEEEVEKARKVFDSVGLLKCAQGVAHQKKLTVAGRFRAALETGQFERAISKAFGTGPQFTLRGKDVDDLNEAVMIRASDFALFTGLGRDFATQVLREISFLSLATRIEKPGRSSGGGGGFRLLGPLRFRCTIFEENFEQSSIGSTVELEERLTDVWTTVPDAEVRKAAMVLQDGKLVRVDTESGGTVEVVQNIEEVGWTAEIAESVRRNGKFVRYRRLIYLQVGGRKFPLGYHDALIDASQILNHNGEELPVHLLAQVLDDLGPDGSLRVAMCELGQRLKVLAPKQKRYHDLSVRISRAVGHTKSAVASLEDTQWLAALSVLTTEVLYAGVGAPVLRHIGVYFSDNKEPAAWPVELTRQCYLGTVATLRHAYPLRAAAEPWEQSVSRPKRRSVRKAGQAGARTLRHDTRAKGRSSRRHRHQPRHRPMHKPGAEPSH